jgi:predicted nucleic acid-binding protein
VILVDTSVWIDHLRAGDKTLFRLLDAALVLSHPFVHGELALGNLRQRETVLNALSDLPRAAVVTDAEVLHFIDSHALRKPRVHEHRSAVVNHRGLGAYIAIA